MNRFSIILLLVFTQTSCSWYGSTGRVYNKKFGLPKNICIIFHEFNYPFDGIENHNEFTEKNVEKFVRSDFKFSFKVSSLKLFHQEISRQQIQQLKAKNYDAILFISRKYHFDTNQTITFWLYDMDENLILKAKHGTYWGNSYYMYPSFKMCTYDAVNGSFEKFKTKILKLK